MAAFLIRHYWYLTSRIYTVWSDLYQNDGDIVLDPGAAVGEITILVSRKVGMNGLITAVEPIPESAIN
jgi:hypothetical protein